MPYRLTEVKSSAYPNPDALSAALSIAGLSVNCIVGRIETFVCSHDLKPNTGYQMSIARELEHYLRQELVAEPARAPGHNRYSPRLNETADVSIAVPDGRHVFVEVEFRPNFEKDLVKFQIGANTGRLLAAVLIVAIDRNAVNPGYTSMPEYQKVAKTLEELAPTYPLLLIGIRGSHV